MSAGVSRSRASEATASTANGIPGVAGRVDVALPAALAERGPDRVGGREHERVGAGPVAVGDHRDVAFGDAGQQAVELARVEQRAVAGQKHDAARRRRPRRGRSRAAPPPSGPRPTGRRAARRRRPRRVRSPRGSPADDDRPLDQRAARRSPRARPRASPPTSGRPLRSSTPGRGATSRPSKRFTGRTTAVALMPRSSGCAEVERPSRATRGPRLRPRPSGSARRASAAPRGRVGVALVDDHRVDQPRVERGDARRPWSAGRPRP